MGIPLTRRSVAIAAAVLAGVALFAAWRGRGPTAERGYVTEKVDRGPIATLVTATGTVNPVSTVQVGTYVSGPIREISADFNSPVRKGQRVAKIDPAPFQMQVAQAEANLANAEAGVEKARADLALKKLTADRNRELLKQNLVAQNDYDTAKSNYDQAVAQLALQQAMVKQNQAALEAARINLGYTDIVSPVDGVVVSRNVDVGQTVAASFQTPTLFLIAQDLTKMQVDSSVSESDIGGVREGQPVEFSVDAYPGRTFKGTVVQVRNAPTTVQNVVTYDVVVGVDNSELALKPGMTASVTITTAHQADVLRLPVRALRFKPDQGDGAAGAIAKSDGAPAKRPAGGEAPAVYVLGPDGEPKRVEVKTGLRTDRYAELVAGDLAAGDAVVVAVKRADAQPPAQQSPFAPQRMR